MKYVVVFGLILIVFWLWRGSRPTRAGEKKPTPKPQQHASLEKVTEIVACQICHIHLPRNEALTGSRGLYCSAEHRQQAGD